MKFTRYQIEKTLEDSDSASGKFWHALSHFVINAVLMLFLCALVLGVSFGYGLFRGIIDSAPDITSIQVAPTAYASKVYDRDGNLTATLVTEGSNRERVEFSEIPDNLINAFVAIEDERFWEHNGVDFKSILRAVKGVLSKDESAGGGSTITQQLIKNNVFGGGLHEDSFSRYVRKFQEQYLALELEDQPGVDKRTMKQNIITAYLNTINLGSNTLGVKVGARRYFNKSVSELDLAECTVLASITKNPSALNPITHPEANQRRRLQVLSNMVEQGYITDEQKEQAASMDVYEEIQNANVVISQENSAPFSYFTDELTEQVATALEDRLGYSAEDAKKAIYSGGLSIYTTQDPKIQAIVDQEVNDPANYDTVKYSLEWKLTIRKEDGSYVNYSERDVENYLKEGAKQNFNGLFKTEEEAKQYVDQFKQAVMTGTDTIVGENFKTVLEPQVSVVLMNPHTGEVLAISGGRGPKTESLSLNRATKVLRQPGSTFKVLTSFAPAIENFGATLASTYYDSEYTVGNKTFRNWYSHGFLGYQTIRDGIQYSLNIVAVRCLMETVHPKNGRAFAESLGITSLVDEDENAALALGGITNGVSNLELTQAFGAIANGGKLNKAKFFTKIVDQNGKVLLDLTEDQPTQVMKDTTAYLLTDAMAGSMLPNRAFAAGLTVNSTSTRAHFDGMSLAGKSGTTTNNNDIWFEGFSPYYICGIWAGCDENQSLKDSKTGEYNGGTGFHKDIWRKIMSRVHEGLSDPGFTRPSNIVEAEVCRKSGKLPKKGCTLDYRGSAVETELFAAGTVPTEDCDVHTSWGSIIVPEGETGSTDDRSYARPEPETTEETSASPENDNQDEHVIISEQGPGIDIQNRKNRTEGEDALGPNVEVRPGG